MSSDLTAQLSATHESKLKLDSLPSIAVVIVHWMNNADTVECLHSLAEVDYPCLSVILVNNGSPDFEEYLARQALPAVQIITSDHNLGVAGGNNLGITKALEQGYDLIFLLNPDTVVRPNLIRTLLPAFDEAGVGIVGPIITYYDAPDKIWFAGGIYSWLVGSPRQPQMNRPLKSSFPTRSVDWLNSCALLAKREVFETVGKFWEDLFMYFDELEFCLRASRADYRCVLVGEPLVYHKVSASAGVRGTNHFSPDKAYYFGRNPFLLLRRHASGVWKVTGLLGQFGVVLPYWTLRCMLGNNMMVLPDYLNGMWDGLRGRTGKRLSRTTESETVNEKRPPN
jgi:GT2 family glycosyltransferase